MEKYDLIIVGAGPAGIFTAVELLRHGSKKHILLVEKGKPVVLVLMMKIRLKVIIL